MHLYSESV